MPWRSSCPDLTIIENLQIDLKGAVPAGRPRNPTELEDFCKEEQAKIPQTRTERIMATKKSIVILFKRVCCSVLTIQGAQMFACHCITHF